MSRSGWAPWQTNRPDRLPTYVQPDLVTELLGGVPKVSGAGRPQRVRHLYEAMLSRDIVYDDGVAGRDGDTQLIRSPYEVLSTPRHGSCVDLAIVFAGAALSVGLHPVLVIVDGSAAQHALVIVWVGGELGQAAPQLPSQGEMSEIRTGFDQPGDWLAVDVSTVARGYPAGRATDVAHSVVQASELLSARRWLAAVDCGTPEAGVGLERPANGPEIVPVLHTPYAPRPEPPGGDRGDLGFRLDLVNADVDVVPFRRRVELEQLRHELDLHRTDRRLHVALVSGVGGSGKSRLIAELCRDPRVLIGPWHGGWLPPNQRDEVAIADARLRWLASTVSP